MDNITIVKVDGTNKLPHCINANYENSTLSTGWSLFTTTSKILTFRVLLTDDKKKSQQFYITSGDNIETKIIPYTSFKDGNELVIKFKVEDTTCMYSLYLLLDNNNSLIIYNVLLEPTKEENYSLGLLYKYLVGFLLNDKHITNKYILPEKVVHSFFALRQGAIGSKYSFSLKSLMYNSETNCNVQSQASYISQSISKSEVIKKCGFIHFCVLAIIIHPKYKISCFRNMAERTLKCAGIQSTFVTPFISKISKMFYNQITDINEMDQITKLKMVQDWIFEMNVICEGKSEKFYDEQMKSDYTFFMECDMSGLTTLCSAELYPKMIPFESHNIVQRKDDKISLLEIRLLELEKRQQKYEEKVVGLENQVALLIDENIFLKKLLQKNNNPIFC